jgi:hypothetical protein
LANAGMRGAPLTRYVRCTEWMETQRAVKRGSLSGVSHVIAGVRAARFPHMGDHDGSPIAAGYRGLIVPSAAIRAAVGPRSSRDSVATSEAPAPDGSSTG